MKIPARFQAGAYLEHLAQILVRGPGISRGFQHHQRSLLEVGRDGIARLEDVGNIRLAILVQRRRHTNDDRLDLAHARKIRRSRQALCLHHFTNRCRINVFNVTTPGVDGLDLRPIHVQTDHFHSVSGKLQTQRQPHVSQSNNSYFHNSMLPTPRGRCPMPVVVQSQSSPETLPLRLSGLARDAPGCSAVIGNMQMTSTAEQTTLDLESLATAKKPAQLRSYAGSLAAELSEFREFGAVTRQFQTAYQSAGQRREVATFVNEFWTARQRQASSLHEVSYRACFKPQLPRFFIERLTQPGDVVYDPFMGRGTTPIEAALLGRVPFGNDINPLSLTFTQPRLHPPNLAQIEAHLRKINLADLDEFPEDLLAFYHPETLREICALKKYLLRALRQTEAMPHRLTCPDGHPLPFRRGEGRGKGLDDLSTDAWLCMVALNRLTGHSPGFFSVYTLPPNQAVSVVSQRKINAKRNQVPPRRDVVKIILKKSNQLLGDVTPAIIHTLQSMKSHARFTNAAADATPELPAKSVSLVVTSPPFLNVVQYADDNWLRCWFLGIDPKSVALTVPRKLDAWAAAMTKVFHELHRVLKSGGHVAFEVGEVHGGKTKLEETVLPCGVAAGLDPVLVLINDQKFSKTANCWGVDNMSKGTNTNRVVLFRKP